MMLTDLCKEINNFFETKKVFGVFTISSGVISPSDFLQNNQYFKICGSIFNDGVHKFGDTLTDETFNGSVWSMAVPQSVIDLSTEIDEFNSANAQTSYSSESFGGYSYSRATNAQGAPLSWQEVFGGKLRKWRKL